MITRRDSTRGKMVNYSHMLIMALSVTSLVLLIKYKNLVVLMTEKENNHIHNQKLILDDLGKESDRNKVLKKEMDKRLEVINAVEERLKGTQTELTNSVNALQASNDQIEALKLEKQSQLEEIESVRKEKEDLVIHLNSLEDEIQKTKAMVNDHSLTVKDSQDKQEKLLAENTKLTEQIASYRSLQGENENLKTQIKHALNAVKVSEDRVKELETQLNQHRELTNPKPVQNPAKVGDQQKADIPAEETPKGNPEAANLEEQGKEEAIEKDLAAYDMLDEEEKAKLKRELQENEIADGGEVEDNGENPVAEEAESRLVDDEGREADNPNAENNADEDQNDNAEENANIMYPDAMDAAVVDDGVNPAGGDEIAVADPKAFGEAIEEGGSFDSPGKRAPLSWQVESSKR